MSISEEKKIADVIVQAILKTVNGPRVKGLIDELEARLAQLEQRVSLLELSPKSRQGSLRYVGIWDAQQQYNLGDVATHDGSMWHANVSTRARPGAAGGAWTLCVKHGKDGRDAKNPQPSRPRPKPFK